MKELSKMGLDELIEKKKDQYSRFLSAMGK